MDEGEEDGPWGDGPSALKRGAGPREVEAEVATSNSSQTSPLWLRVNLLPSPPPPPPPSPSSLSSQRLNTNCLVSWFHLSSPLLSFCITPSSKYRANTVHFK